MTFLHKLKPFPSVFIKFLWHVRVIKNTAYLAPSLQSPGTRFLGDCQISSKLFTSSTMGCANESMALCCHKDYKIWIQHDSQIYLRRSQSKRKRRLERSLENKGKQRLLNASYEICDFLFYGVYFGKNDVFNCKSIGNVFCWGSMIYGVISGFGVCCNSFSFVYYFDGRRPETFHQKHLGTASKC